MHLAKKHFALFLPQASYFRDGQRAAEAFPPLPTETSRRQQFRKLLEENWRERAGLTPHTRPRTHATSQDETSLRRNQNSLLISSDAFTFAQTNSDSVEEMLVEWVDSRTLDAGCLIYLFRHIKNDTLISTIFCSVWLKEMYGIKRHLNRHGIQS